MANERAENLPDDVLVIAAILGDLQSFDALELRYRAAAYRVAQVIAGSDLAEDVVQESLRLHKAKQLLREKLEPERERSPRKAKIEV
jgi:hypothetical protein